MPSTIATRPAYGKAVPVGSLVLGIDPGTTTMALAIVEIQTGQRTLKLPSGESVTLARHRLVGSHYFTSKHTLPEYRLAELSRKAGDWLFKQAELSGIIAFGIERNEMLATERRGRSSVFLAGAAWHAALGIAHLAPNLEPEFEYADLTTQMVNKSLGLSATAKKDRRRIQIATAFGCDEWYDITRDSDPRADEVDSSAIAYATAERIVSYFDPQVEPQLKAEKRRAKKRVKPQPGSGGEP